MVNKAKISRYQDALSILGLSGRPFETWSENDKGLYADLCGLDEKQHVKSAVGTLVTKAESKAIQFAIPPETHKSLVGHPGQFYVGPRNVLNETPSLFRYREPGPTCKSVARASLGLPDTAPERETHRVISPALAARPWLW